MSFRPLVPFRPLLSFLILIFPKYFVKYIQLGVWRKLLSDTRAHDPFYFIHHRYHLSRRLSLSQRVMNATTHHEYESTHYVDSYEKKVYRGEGIRLWSCEVDGHSFSLTLTGSEKNRNEGELSVILTGDGRNLWRISFTYACGSTFRLPRRAVLFIARNQAEGEDRKIFYECFRQNQPQLFCLSAVCGLALANGWNSILAIRHDHQIAYDKCLDVGFNNSYTQVWKPFASREIDGHVFELPAPLTPTPLSEVSRSHRARARARRKFWEDISLSAQTTLAEYRRRRPDSRAEPAAAAPCA